LSCILACVSLQTPARFPSAGEHIPWLSCLAKQLQFNDTKYWRQNAVIFQKEKKEHCLNNYYLIRRRHFKEKMQHLGRKEETKWNLLVCKVLESRGTMGFISARTKFSTLKA